MYDRVSTSQIVVLISVDSELDSTRSGLVPCCSTSYLELLVVPAHNAPMCCFRMTITNGAIFPCSLATSLSSRRADSELNKA